MGSRTEALKRIANKEAELGNKHNDLSANNKAETLYYSYQPYKETYYTSYRY